MHSEIQESLTDDLLKLARNLKKRTVAMDVALQKRDATIESATDALEYSAAAAKEASKKAAKQYKSYKLYLHFTSHFFDDKEQDRHVSNAVDPVVCWIGVHWNDHLHSDHKLCWLQI